jgi:hypothetical protein
MTDGKDLSIRVGTKTAGRREAQLKLYSFNNHP